ncbi:MAG: L-ribulose-5-phosphate 3-epimerase [Pseudoalteromonas tetraodonis]|jgi:L-ribulose-5-phosphate 3-epimerase
MKTTRRSAIQLLSASSVAACLPVWAEQKKKFPIGACDWCLKNPQHIDAFEVAKKIGLEGVQVSFSTPDSEFDLRDQKVRNQYYQRVEETGIKMASLGMGILNKMPLATNPDSITWVSDAIDVMALMAKQQPDKSTDICLLAFFGRGDINGKPELMDAVIKKLRTVAKKAEDAGVILGIESYLSADDHLEIIDGVGSKAIQIYYDTANSNKMGYNIYEEVVQLGADRICQIHCKEIGALIGEGVIDFPKFKISLDKIGYSDWLIIEGSTPKGAKVVDAYQKNLATLDGVFR